MKTTVFALSILTIILAAGIWFHTFLTNTCSRYDTALNVCLAQAKSNHWNDAIQTLKELKLNWKSKRPFFATLTHHTLLDQVQTALIRTEAAAMQHDGAEFALEHSSLKESDSTNVANIF